MRTLMKLVAGAVCVSFIVALVGCERGDPSKAVTGRWKIELSYRGPSLSGKMETTGSIVDTSGQLSGMVTGTHNGENVSFSGDNVRIPPGTTYQCSGTYDGATMEGSCKVSSKGMTASGSFTATRE